MGIDISRVSVVLLDAAMTDQQLKEELLFVREYRVKSVVVLPFHVQRTKQLLEGTAICVGSIADYPLGAGTLGKQAFETGELYKNGATEVYVTATPENLQISKQTYQMLASLSFGKGQLGFFIQADEMDEEARNRFALQLGRVRIKLISLGTNLPAEHALFHLGVFRAARERQLQIHVSVGSPTLLEMELLFQAGAHQIGINNPRDILPLIE